MNINEEDYLAHYGILRRSGRYPWGSGKDAEQRGRTFLSMVEDLKKQGLSEAEIARGFSTQDHPFTTQHLRDTKTIALNAKKAADIARINRLKFDKGYSNVAIGKMLGIPEPTVRSMLKPGVQEKTTILETTANMLRDQVAKKKYVDVGVGTEHHLLGISNTKLNTALAVLKDEGYQVHTVDIAQLGTGLNTRTKVLAPPGTTQKEVWQNRDKIRLITDYTEDGGRTFYGTMPPLSIDSKRIAVKYKEDGGDKADGVIYVRPGVDDVSLGPNRYAQVRIAVDGTHFLKGMAMYKDDLPEGADLVFNTNKSNTGNKLDAMKPFKKSSVTDEVDPDNPFGAVFRQIGDKDERGNITRVKSAMNLVNEEADWEKWAKTLSSQVLSKQKPTLAKQQLDLGYQRKRAELDEILSLTNPIVKHKLLQSYSDSADSAAVHLKAAPLPNQKTHVILPVASMKETEIYAPNYDNGERVVLIRFPHGGKFEIPELTVNNRQPEAKKLLGDARNAVGINHKVAQHLSGADFDGDTVLVIPNRDKKIQTEHPLEGLKNFDPQRDYKYYEGMQVMTPRQKGQEMGLVSNLITDMTIKGASNAELAHAVKHSMVVIDAEKHKLNWKQSALDNGIAQLREKYQRTKQGGADTVISNSGKNAKVYIPDRELRKASEGGKINPATGELVWVPTGKTRVMKVVNKRTGEVTEKIIRKEIKVPKLEVNDANIYSSGTRMEQIYADHSNRMKALANEARKALVAIKPNPTSSSAKAAYAEEVKALESKLNLALRNAPLERQAQVLANAQVAAKRAAYPDMEESDLKKIKSQALTGARIRTGAGKKKIEITDSEWDAIQAGAITPNKLNQILQNTDLNRVKELATPKSKVLMSPTYRDRAKAMMASGFTRAEIAKQLGVSLSTLNNSLKEVS